MITKIEHIGIAVKDPKKSNEIFEKLLGHTSFKSELIESQGVKTHFYQVGESKIELLEATSDNSPINKYLQKRGEGMHHLALYVEDIHLGLKFKYFESNQLIKFLLDSWIGFCTR